MRDRLHFVCVTTDDRDRRLWVAVARSPAAALDRVLNAIPEGWTARIMDDIPDWTEIPEIVPGEAREISGDVALPGAFALARLLH